MCCVYFDNKLDGIYLIKIKWNDIDSMAVLIYACRLFNAVDILIQLLKI